MFWRFIKSILFDKVTIIPRAYYDGASRDTKMKYQMDELIEAGRMRIK